ncbi:MAG: dihydropteroate synthase [Candidatus Krumholzibacteriia bacterium]
MAEMHGSGEARTGALSGVAFFMGERRLAWRPSPLLMGVVNVTPDSFSDGGRFLETDAAVRHALHLVEDGADLIDVGGESSRPGAQAVPLDEELRRVVPVLRELRPRVGVPISIDTTKAEVARRALDLGADIVNDISGLRFDAGMLPLLAETRCGVVLMHMLGVPRNMQAKPHYDDVVRDVGRWLARRLEEVSAAGIAPERILLDPGIGFGKRFSDNLALLRRLDRLRIAGRPLLVGASRKTFLGWLLDEPDPARRLEGDLAVAAFCRSAGVEIVRVHDVRATRRVFRVLDALDGNAPADPSLDPTPPDGR